MFFTGKIHRKTPVSPMKFLRTHFLQEHLWWLLLKKGDFKSFDFKIISGKHFKDHLSTARSVAFIYLECLRCLFDPKKFNFKNKFEKLFL